MTFSGYYSGYIRVYSNLFSNRCKSSIVEIAFFFMLAYLSSIMATTLAGAADPPTIFNGNTHTLNPEGG